MEEKLLELKEQFCKWYCPNRDEVVTETAQCNGNCYCPDCETTFLCDDQPNIDIEPCYYCQISEYIKFIRDELQ